MTILLLILIFAIAIVLKRAKSIKNKINSSWIVAIYWALKDD